MSVREELLDRIATRQHDALTLVTELIRRPSENPPGDTRAAAAWVAEWLKKAGHTPEVIEARETLANVVAVIDNGPGRSMILNGHLDTFPVTDRAAWERDPFSGAVEDGKIHGRGVADMKAGTAASIFAFCLLGEMRAAWKGRLILAAVADEETMGPWGANYVVDHHPKLTADATLIGEPSTPGTVRFGEKGMVWIALESRGTSSHSAYPHHGWNAIFDVVEALAELRQLETMTWPVPEEFLRRIDEARESHHRDAAPGHHRRAVLRHRERRPHRGRHQGQHDGRSLSRRGRHPRAPWRHHRRHPPRGGPRRPSPPRY
jgi:succinyl-diaminopimelate desuccinylase